MKKISAIILCIVMITVMLSSCSKPPELEEIKERLSELLEASQDVNALLFGEGLDVYERVSDPHENIVYYKDEQTGKAYYYYTLADSELGTVIAYRPITIAGVYTYVQKTDLPPENGEYEFYNSDSGYYYIRLDGYVEKTSEFYYSDEFPEDYDVVRLDSKYLSIDEIKKYASTVYSEDYLNSVYEALFDGAIISDNISNTVLSARYSEFTDETGNTWLLKSNTYKPVISEKRIYDISTAEIVKPSNKNYINVKISSYLESNPDNIVSVRVSLCLIDGVWMLDSATY